jgi:hypothetical protein
MASPPPKNMDGTAAQGGMTTSALGRCSCDPLKRSWQVGGTPNLPHAAQAQ